jgi:hypothetical protein
MGLGFIYVVNPITVFMKSPFHTKSRSKHREPPFSLSLWASTKCSLQFIFQPPSTTHAIPDNSRLSHESQSYLFIDPFEDHSTL